MDDHSILELALDAAADALQDAEAFEQAKALSTFILAQLEKHTADQVQVRVVILALFLAIFALVDFQKLKKKKLKKELH